SAVSWLSVAFSYTLAMRVVDLHVGLEAGIAVALATTFSLLIPGLPASVGLFEAATIVALKPFGVGAARALSAGVVIHVFTFVPFLVLGPVALHGVVLRRPRDVLPPEPEAAHEADPAVAWVARASSPRQAVPQVAESPRRSGRQRVRRCRSSAHRAGRAGPRPSRCARRARAGPRAVRGSPAAAGRRC